MGKLVDEVDETAVEHEVDEQHSKYKKQKCETDADQDGAFLFHGVDGYEKLLGVYVVL